jgi:hypothetical protein
MKKISMRCVVELEPRAWRRSTKWAAETAREEIRMVGNALFAAIMDERQRRMRIIISLKRRRP